MTPTEQDKKLREKMGDYFLNGSDLNRQQLASKLGVTRMTLYNWLRNPDKMPLGAYKRLQALGIEVDGVSDGYEISKCVTCDGTGLIFAPVTPNRLDKEGL